MADIMIDFPSDIQIVSEISIYNRKKLRSRAVASTADGVTTVFAQKFDDDTEAWVEEKRFSADRGHLRAVRDKFTAYANLIDDFITETRPA